MCCSVVGNLNCRNGLGQKRLLKKEAAESHGLFYLFVFCFRPWPAGRRLVANAGPLDSGQTHGKLECKHDSQHSTCSVE